MNAPSAQSAQHYNGIDPDADWSSLVLLEVLEDEAPPTAEPIGYVFVIEPDKENALYKLAGGHKKKCAVPPETPPETGSRETLGETHLKVHADDLTYLGKHWKRNHWAVYFSGTVRKSALGGMCPFHPENEGEEPKFFTVQEYRELLERGSFLMLHYWKLQEFGKFEGWPTKF